MSAVDQHIIQIPNAVAIASSQDPNLDPQLKQEAIVYLGKVKELGEETWQVSFLKRQGLVMRE